MTVLFHGLRTSVLAGLACAVILGGHGAAKAADVNTEPTQVSAEAALQGAISGSEAGLRTLQLYLSGASGRSKEMEERANGLIKALAASEIASDTDALQEAIASISQAARQSLFATPIAKVKVVENFRLSPNSIGFDFGPPDSSIMPHFQHVTAKDKRLGGADRRALRRPSPDQLLSDGVVNVEKFSTGVPNGKYRVVLMTDNLGIGSKFDHPLGKKINVNGNEMNIAQNKPASWLNEGSLTNQGARVGSGSDKEGDGIIVDGPPSVGMAHEIVASVRGVLPSKSRDLDIRDEVYSNEKINTGPGSAARLIFRDNTILSLGANSSVTLDKFIFDPKGSKSQVTLSLTKGVMRFVSGDLAKDRYSIRTPVATMGIRGTILEITVAANGATTTTVIEGAAVVSSAGTTRRVNSGFTTRVRRGRPPTPPKANPPRPVRQKALRTALGPDPSAVAAAAAVSAAVDKGKAPPEDPVEKPTGKAGGSNSVGGMVIVEVEVVDGKLVIEFDKLASLSTYLTAIIIEPVDEPSNFDLQGEVEEHYQRDQESLVSSNAKIEEQIGALLSEIATAAGPQQLAEALGIDTTAVELDTTTSPN